MLINTLKKINQFFEKFLFVNTAISSILFFSIVLISVLTRYLFKTPILASVELSRLFFIWSCFLAASLTYRKRAHIGFTLLFEKMPLLLQRWVTVLIYLCIFIFLSIVFYQSILISKLLWQTDLPMLQISQSWFYLPLPLVSMIMIFYTLEFFIDDFSQKGEVQ